MRNIVLLCAAGMSTSLLVSKMQQAAEEEGYEVKIEAHPVASASTLIPDADAILLGPQVRFNLKKLQEEYPDKKIAAIEMMDYGMVNGKAVLKLAKDLIGD